MSDPNGDVFHAMVAGKIADIKNAVKDIEDEIKERNDIDSAVLAEIENEILEARNRILEVEQFSGMANPFPKADVLERALIELEGQKRNEKVSCWRDLTTLRRELRIYIRELNDLLRKSELVKNDSGRRFIKEA